MKKSIFILIFVLSLLIKVHSVPLDSSCSSDNECDGDQRSVCRDRRCQCNQPWARACNSTCEWSFHVIHQGLTCLIKDNCQRNMDCVDGRCRCLPEFFPVDGVCLKPLNNSCQQDWDCFSNYCLSSRCECRPGYEADQDGLRCRIKLVKVYKTLSESNGTNQTCINSLSCIDALAECVAEGRLLTERYCRCPDGYRVTQNNERCEPDESTELSPLDFRKDIYPSCGFCRDENAACIKADNQTTCWCRAPYRKVSEQCQSHRNFLPLIIFPNEFDRFVHDYTTNCTSSMNDTRTINYGLCTATGRCRYNPMTRRCEKNQINFINEIYEYGLCTRIDSRNIAWGDENLCPEPLRCEGRQDKFVCTCGRGRFLDLANSTRCVNYIGQPSVTGGLDCPLNNTRINTTTNTCECRPGFQPLFENRICGLILSTEVGIGSCDTGPALHSECAREFGNGALYCRPGECRCIGDQIVPNANRSSCVAILNEFLSVDNPPCPPGAIAQGRRCTCVRGYRPDSTRRLCELYPATLSPYVQETQEPPEGFNSADCRVLFTGPVQYLSDGSCQCLSSAFINDAGNGCWYQLEITVQSVFYRNACIPNANILREPRCRCDIGFKPQDGRCVRAADRLYDINDTSAIAEEYLNFEACVFLFGLGATFSASGRFCTCRLDAYPINSFTYCLFYVDRVVDIAKGPDTCPPNTFLNVYENRRSCSCLPGFYPSIDARFCEPTNLTLVGIQEYTPTIQQCCASRKPDCEAKFGLDAFFFNGSCYCNQRSSYVNATNQCESLSNYLFPGLHHLSNYSCERDEDCGNLETLKCSYLTNFTSYKVCQCRDGWFLNVAEQTCVRERCFPSCATDKNFECRGYQCVCRRNYYFNGTACISNYTRLTLGQVCNATATYPIGLNGTNFDNTWCNQTCRRVECAPGSQNAGRECIRQDLEYARCFDRPSTCLAIDRNSVCNPLTYRCTCGASQYRWGSNCAQAVNSRCSEDDQCGGGAQCKGGRCLCGPGKSPKKVTDIYGRFMDRCLNISGGSRMEYYFLLHSIGILLSIRQIF